MKKTKNTENTKVPIQTNQPICEVCLGEEYITYMHGNDLKDLPCPICNDVIDLSTERLTNGFPHK